jgi:hypothetical protein
MLTLFVVAVVAVLYCVVMIARAVITKPLTTSHRLYLERSLSVHVALLVVAVLVLGFAGERVFP